MEFTQMRDFSEFCEQLHDMRLKFHKWDSCERTVALYYLMAGLPFANARFLQHAIERCIAAVNTPEAQILEKNANDPKYISNILTEHPQNALSLLLTHLPLLQPGNKETANCYLSIIKKVLSEFITPPYRIYNECVEIMSYVFVHPAFDKNDKKTFKHLLKQVLNKVSPETFVHSPVNSSSDESVSPNQEPVLDSVRLNRRSNSLTPGQTKPDGPYQNQVWSSQENLTQPSPKQRSYSLSNDKTLPINAPPIQVSSSETRLQDIEGIKNYPVMRSIVSWLKSLRLHKYSWIFTNLSYHQMLNLDENTLEGIGITKGARHKLLLNIGKLKERSLIMTELETDVMNGGDLNSALKKMKNLLQTPLQVSIREDLPMQFVKVMGKVFTQLLMLRQPTDEILSLFNTICERADLSDAFTDDQKHRLSMWQTQLNKRPMQLPFSIQFNGLVGQRPNHSQYVHNVAVSMSTCQQPQQSFAQKSSSFPNVKIQPMNTGHRHSIGSVTLQNHLQNHPAIGSRLQERQTVFSHHNNTAKLKETGSQFHVRFQNVEDNEVHRKQQLLKNLDIESSLESLCLQMMEHALGP